MPACAEGNDYADVEMGQGEQDDHHQPDPWWRVRQLAGGDLCKADPDADAEFDPTGPRRG